MDLAAKSEKFISDLNDVYNDYSEKYFLRFSNDQKNLWKPLNFFHDSLEEMRSKLEWENGPQIDQNTIDFTFEYSRHSEWKKLGYLPPKEHIIYISEKISAAFIKLFELVVNAHDEDVFNKVLRYHFSDLNEKRITEEEGIGALVTNHLIYYQLDHFINYENCQRRLLIYTHSMEDKKSRSFHKKLSQLSIPKTNMTKEKKRDLARTIVLLKAIFFRSHSSQLPLLYYKPESQAYGLPTLLNEIISEY